MPQVKLENWRPHVLAALQAKQPLAQYAREHGLSRHTLYGALQRMKACGEIVQGLEPKKIPRSAFVPVQIEPVVHSALRVRLPNGLELHFAGVDAGLLSLLASLPCLS